MIELVNKTIESKDIEGELDMRLVRPIIYIVMAACIGFGGFLLTTQRVDGNTVAGTGVHPTAYIEMTETSASFKMAGRVTELLVKEGDRVVQGQPIARLQSAELEAKVAQADAAVALAQGKIAEAEGARATAQAKKQQAQAGVKVTADTAEQQVAQAKAAVAAAQAKVDALHNGARPEEKQQAEIQLRAAKEVFALAEANRDRMAMMLEEGLVSQAEADKVSASYQEAKAKYELAEQQVQLVNEGARKEEIQAAEATLQQAKAALLLAEANREQVAVREGDVAAASAAIQQAEGALQSAKSAEAQAKASRQEAEAYVTYTELLAPSDGVILSENAHAGELVSAGYPVFTIQSTSDVPWAKFYLPETDVIGIQAGDAIAMKLLATGQTLEGKVLSVAAAPDYAVKKATQNLGEADVRSFGVKVELPDLPEGAVAGMTLEWIGRGGAE